MECTFMPRQSVEKHRKRAGKWGKLLDKLTSDNALVVAFPDTATLRRYQPRLYEAAMRCGKSIETFRSTEDGKLFLNIVLRNHSGSP